jgi:uncharacterized membrane protein YeaQ/YmgE (transglycosylase-associated protein family)
MDRNLFQFVLAPPAIAVITATPRHDLVKIVGGVQHPREPCIEARVYNEARDALMSIIWTIIIGFIAGVIAKFIMPGDNEPKGFILTILLGIAGAFLATWLGQAIGWYGPNDQAGLIGAVVGALIVLFIWGAIVRRRA